MCLNRVDIGVAASLPTWCSRRTSAILFGDNIKKVLCTIVVLYLFLPSGFSGKVNQRAW